MMKVMQLIKWMNFGSSCSSLPWYCIPRLLRSFLVVCGGGCSLCGLVGCPSGWSTFRCWVGDSAIISSRCLWVCCNVGSGGCSSNCDKGCSHDDDDDDDKVSTAIDFAAANRLHTTKILRMEPLRLKDNLGTWVVLVLVFRVEFGGAKAEDEEHMTVAGCFGEQRAQKERNQLRNNLHKRNETNQTSLVVAGKSSRREKHSCR